MNLQMFGWKREFRIHRLRTADGKGKKTDADSTLVIFKQSKLIRRSYVFILVKTF